MDAATTLLEPSRDERRSRRAAGGGYTGGGAAAWCGWRLQKAVEGRAETAAITALELARQFEDAGAAAVIYTDIARDGAMQGPNIDATLDLADSVSIPVILSGGVSSIDDLATIKTAAGDRLEGVISGRAVYDGHIDVAEATALLAGST